MSERRVVITGYGAVTPVGRDMDSTWKALLNGESGIRRISYFDASTFPTQIAGEAKDFDFWNFWRKQELPYRLPETISQTTKLAIMAGLEAWRHAGLSSASIASDRIGVYMGAGKGEALSDFRTIGRLVPKSLDSMGKFDIGRFVAAALADIQGSEELEIEPGRAGHHLAGILGLEGPNSTCLTACAAGAQAVGEALRLIRNGEADVVLAGGGHSMITPQGIIGFNLLGALSTDNADPTRASRPFDKTRNGFVLSEGAAILVLEELEQARRRGAHIIAELRGYGCTADAFRVTDPNPDALSGAEAIRKALDDGRVNKDQIQYVNAHGTSTLDNDETETKAIKRIFGERAYSIPVSSTKSMTGHLIAAAGALETIICCCVIRDGIIPATMNYQEKDEACDLDYVPNRPRESRVDAAVTNSFGFGGQNTSLVVSRYA